MLGFREVLVGHGRGLWKSESKTRATGRMALDGFVQDTNTKSQHQSNNWFIHPSSDKQTRSTEIPWNTWIAETVLRFRWGKKMSASSKYMFRLELQLQAWIKLRFGTWWFQKNKNEKMIYKHGHDWSWFTLFSGYPGFISIMKPFHNHCPSACEATPRSTCPGRTLCWFAYQMSAQGLCCMSEHHTANDDKSKH